MPTLTDRFRGCIAASWIGSAMGAPVEGWSPQKIQETYGELDRLVSYQHYDNGWDRPPGTTEDGIERQKMMATAIIEKQDRINAVDLVKVWLRDLDPERMSRKQEPFDLSLLELARTGMPPAELGQSWPFPNVVAMARASHPLGLINAGDPRGAADDTLEVGKVYAPQTAFALRWAGLYNAALAEALKPDARVDTVLERALEFAGYRAECGDLYARYDTTTREIERALELARESSSPTEMREKFYQHYYGGHYFNYGQSQANEIVSKGLAVFALCEGNPREAIVTAVNCGRDTDCLAAVAGGLSGALEGTSELPEEWIQKVDDATLADPYTNNGRTIQETADGLLEAFVARMDRLRHHAETMRDSV